MANQLKMAKVQAIIELYRGGWSQRRIARELGIDRETVARYVGQAAVQAKPATLPTGNSAGNESGALEGTGQGPPASGHRTGAGSICEPYRAVIVAKLEQQLSAQRIHQDLMAEHGFVGGYDSVKRFVRGLGANLPLPMRRMERAPGTEVQVDFGTGAPVITPEGKRRTTHVFRMILSHSRKGYSEATYRQTTDDFIRCLENAFRHFGGVPETVVIDNLKAAVHQADWYDPELNPKLASFCRHYGTVILPTKPRMPRHKGKVERGIGYVKGNALKGRTFTSLEEENRHLADWEERVADRRIHGTTRQQVGKVFQEVERAALRPLPADPFPDFREAQRSVHRDGHVEVAKAYYSVPPEYVGRTVWVRWDSRVVRVFNQRMEEIAIHARHEQGRFSTQGAHIAAEKVSGLERGARWLMMKVGAIGPQTAAWAQAMLTARGIEGTRVLMGLIALTRKHPGATLESACKTALSYGEFRLRSVRALIQRQAEVVQAALPFLQEHPLIRPLDDYARIVAAALERKAQTQSAPGGKFTVRFERHGRADECASQQRNSPGPPVADRGLRVIHPPGSGYSSSGCAPAGPDSASPDDSSLPPPFPPLPGESLHDE